jgi:hypothetical protein
MSAGLIAALQANPNCLKADCFVVTLPTGLTMYVTEGQFDLIIPSGTNGWTGGLGSYHHGDILIKGPSAAPSGVTNSLMIGVEV